MYFHRLGLVLLFEIVVGAGLFWNCLLGLIQREGMYDAGSSEIMFWSQVLGLVIGGGLVIHALWLIGSWCLN